jgi:hypothetical protein
MPGRGGNLHQALSLRLVMRRNLLFLALATVFLLPACADTSAPGETRFGRYSLRSINGGQPPAPVYENAIAQIQFLSGALRLNDNFTFTDSTHVHVFRTRDGDEFTTIDVATGTFRMTTDTVYLASSRGENYHMRFGSSGSLIQNLEGTVLLYRK